MLSKAILLAATLFFTRSLCALDLTPNAASRELEGIQIPIVLFADGARKVAYQPPAAWRLSSGSADVLQLYPSNREHAVMQFRIRPANGASAAVADEAEARVRALLPEDAVDVKLSGHCESPFMLGGLASDEFTFAYVASGRRFITSIATVDLSEEQRLVVMVTAGANDFKVVHDEGLASLFSWVWRE